MCRTSRRYAGLIVLVTALLVVAALSLAIGARAFSLPQVWQGLVNPRSAAWTDVRGLRVPRTLLGLVAGAALGVAGGLTRALTRNPLADPGLLGVNAGAAAAVVSVITFTGLTSIGGYIWFAFAGAGMVSALVWAVAGGGRSTPARLALAGMAVTAALYAYVNAVELLDTNSLDLMRFWTVGSLAGARPGTVGVITPFVAVGALLAVLVARPLNALLLGEESARALGARPATVRAISVLAVTLLCGAATAACGPIVFIGLIAPHLARSFAGPDVRWTLAYSAVLAPLVLLVADILGRVVARPGEIEVGVVTAVLGGPVFVVLARRTRLAGA